MVEFGKHLGLSVSQTAIYPGSTAEQWGHLQQQAEQPVRVCDPSQRENFVLLRAEVYERFKALFEEDPVSEQERRFHLQAFGHRAGWDDPAMDVYDDLDPRRTP